MKGMKPRIKVSIYDYNYETISEDKNLKNIEEAKTILARKFEGFHFFVNQEGTIFVTKDRFGMINIKYPNDKVRSKFNSEKNEIDLFRVMFDIKEHVGESWPLTERFYETMRLIEESGDKL